MNLSHENELGKKNYTTQSFYLHVVVVGTHQVGGGVWSGGQFFCVNFVTNYTKNTEILT
jgi:ribulose 1,5-bisphosphate synthetase/thiazole synthase